MRVALCAVVFAFFGLSSANAAQEQKCSDQYSLEEHLYLEWAALGGDPHAQFALSKCAAPRTKASLSDEEKIYALKWLTLAACDADGLPGVDDRDRMTRRLKYEGDISFRRFGGITENETWTPREKKFIEYRAAEIDDLKDRRKDLLKKTSVDQQAAARKELSDEFARMGPRGLQRLTALSECEYFGEDKVLSAAAWMAAEQAWSSSGVSKLYNDRKKGWDAARESKTRLAGLSPAERRAADFEKERLLRTDPHVMAELEDRAALARLGELSFMHEAAGRVSFAGRSVTLAVQYALEALGWMEFQNGPDNDYGPATIEAVQRMQAAEGLDETRWLSPADIRAAICDAAVRKNDPVSYYHLSVMFAEGWGYPRDLDRAQIAAARADALMEEKLAAFDALPEWKQNAYPVFEKRIDVIKTMINDKRAALPAHVSSSGQSFTQGPLCN